MLSKMIVSSCIVMKLLLLLCTLWTVSVNGQNTQGRCTSRNGEFGNCKKISECVPVQNSIRRGVTNHVVCGYQGFTQIVCCPSAQPVVATTTNQPIWKRVSDRKCDEYNELTYKKIYTSHGTGPPAVNKVLNCPFKSVPLIVGGTDATIGEFPHMALIGFGEVNAIQWSCGGTLISEQFVLSAAHCFYSEKQGPAKYVRLGEYDQNRADDSTVVDLRIIQSIQHPEYRPQTQHNDDIGLFKLERTVELNGAIRPACLPQVSAVPTISAIATGWGAVTWRGRSSNVLLKVTLDMFSHSECSSKFSSKNRRKNQIIVEETQVCAGSHTEERDTCQGDSGGPLQIYHGTHPCSYVVVGVTSFGKSCGLIGYPGVYTRVYGYLSWIEGIVWPNQ